MALSINDIYQPVRMDLSALSQPRESGLDSLLKIAEMSRRRKADKEDREMRKQEAEERRQMNELNRRYTEEKMNDLKTARAKDNAINSAYGMEMKRLETAPIGPDDEAFDPVTTPLKVRRDVSMGQGAVDDAVAIQKNLTAIEDLAPKPKHGVEVAKDGEVIGYTQDPDGNVSVKVLREGKVDPKDRYINTGQAVLDISGGPGKERPVWTAPRSSGGSGGSGTGGGLREAREFRQGWNAVSAQRRNVEKVLSDLQDPAKSAMIPEAEKIRKTQELQSALAELKDTENYYANKYFEATGRHPGDSSGAGINDTYGPFGGKVPVPTTAQTSNPPLSGKSVLERLRKMKGK